MPIVLVPLATLVIVLWVIACAAAIAVIMGYVSGALSGLPWPVDKLAGPVGSLAQGITNVCGKLEAGVDHLIGASWHALARYTDKLWEQIEAQAHLTWAVTAHLGEQVYDVTRIRKAVDSLIASWKGIEHGVKDLAKSLTRLEQRTTRAEHTIAHGIGDDVLPRLKSLDREVARIEHRTIPALREAEAEAAKSISDLWTWARQNVLVAGTAAFAGAVAVALSTLGLGGLRCPALLSSLSKRGCGLWNGLEDVLGLLFDAAVFLDLCHIIPTIEGLFSDLEGPLVELVSAAANAACAHPPSGWVELTAPPLSLPTSAEITAHL